MKHSVVINFHTLLWLLSNSIFPWYVDV